MRPTSQLFDPTNILLAMKLLAAYRDRLDDMETSCISTLVQELYQARDNRDALYLRMKKAEERISAIAHALYNYGTISIDEIYDTTGPDGRYYTVGDRKG